MSVRLLYNPVANAAEIVRATETNTDFCHVLMQMKPPPYEIVRELALHVKGLTSPSSERIGDVLHSIAFREMNIDSDISGIYPCATSRGPPPSTRLPCLYVSKMIVTLVCVLNNYVNYVSDMITKIILYENVTRSGIVLSNALSDSTRLNFYAHENRTDLEHVQSELTIACDAIARWWLENPKAMYISPTSLIHIFMRLCMLTATITEATIHVIYSIFEKNTVLLNESATLLVAMIITKNESKDIPLDDLQQENVLTTMLGMIRTLNERTLAMVGLLDDIQLKKAPMHRITRLKSFNIEKAMMNVLGLANNTVNSMEVAHLAYCLNLLATLSSQNPRRRVLNLTHHSITSVLSIVDAHRLQLPLRRLITSSTTNRSDFYRYDACMSDDDRKLWWEVLTDNPPPERLQIETWHHTDTIVEHPIISESGIVMGKDQTVRLETVLRHMNRDGVFKDMFTNVETTWDEFIGAEKDVVMMETFY
jgi:hypothetical protein